MREFYTTAEATEKPFLFISYSHDDQATVKAWADYLIDRGVRVWWDKAFLGGDDWETIATTLLSHDNCRGILFFCGQSAIESPNVAKEWRTAAKVKEARPEDGYYAQIIMTEDDPSFDYKKLIGFVKKTEELFSDEDYDYFRDLFGKKDHLYYCAGNEGDKEALFHTIKDKKAKETVDEAASSLDKLTDLANQDKDLILPLGTYGQGRKPLVWHQICHENNTLTMLCQETLSEGLGGQHLLDWMQDFVQQSFSPDEQAALQGKIRTLTVEEAAAVPQSKLAADTIWWLADCDGNLQSVVREDGTVYRSGYNNKLYKKGIRPVFTLDATVLYALVDK